jgi:hypothetical protein
VIAENHGAIPLPAHPPPPPSQLTRPTVTTRAASQIDLVAQGREAAARYQREQLERARINQAQQRAETEVENANAIVVGLNSTMVHVSWKVYQHKAKLYLAHTNNPDQEPSQERAKILERVNSKEIFTKWVLDSEIPWPVHRPGFKIVLTLTLTLTHS